MIDYGAYVDLISTKYEPQGVLAIGSEDEPQWVQVPPQDLRAIRRAILDLDEFEAGEIEDGTGGETRTPATDS